MCFLLCFLVFVYLNFIFYKQPQASNFVKWIELQKTKLHDFCAHTFIQKNVGPHVNSSALCPSVVIDKQVEEVHSVSVLKSVVESSE